MSAARTIVVGAGSADSVGRIDLVGFVVDDAVEGDGVLGGIADLEHLIGDHRVEQIVFSDLQGPAIRRAVSACASHRLRFKIRHGSQGLRDLTLEDLLLRNPVVFAETPQLAGRTAIVTGAAGSIGRGICSQLMRLGLDRLVLLDLDENGLYLLEQRLQREYPRGRVTIEVGDIRDPGRMRAVFDRHRPHDTIHAAAHKHVPLMESAPCEAVKNNILGTRHVASAALACGAERFIYISSDKAVRPKSVMGVSKRVGEEIVRSLARRAPIKCCAIRFGNVLGSAGSVVELFREQIAAGGPVRVTHPDVRRYFMTLDEAVALVLEAGYADHGELCVLDMGEPLRIDDLARNMVTLAGLRPDVDVPIAYTGLRPGDKMAEDLLTEDEERTHRADPRILVATGPPPCDDLDRRVRELEAAAFDEDDRRVLELLQRLVPDYVGPAPVGAASRARAKS